MNIVLLCGGSGTRLWPLSRKKLPKQFLSLVNEKTMFQNTILRFQTSNLNIRKFVIICNKEHEFIVQEQIHNLQLNHEFQIVTEPIGRDSAPAVCMASLVDDENIVSLIVPCDHIFDDDKLCRLIEDATQYCNNSVITFGIQPSYPETGYGYIQTNDKNETLGFKEKPDKETAKTYVQEGSYLWNAGLFMFQNKTMIQCFEHYAPSILKTCKETLGKSHFSNNVCSLNKELFETCHAISVDYAIMEPLTTNNNSINCYTFKYDGKWSDIGSFKTLHDECEKNEDHNTLKGSIITENCENCYIESDCATVATLGIKDLIVVNQRDALLIAHKDQCQDVKKIIAKIPEEDEDLKIVHSKAYRPWGWYINVEGNDHSGFKVKRIGVYPGKRLSLQSHNRRSEHWVIVKGKARVQLDDQFIDMSPNEHVYIPIKALHRMENIGTEMVEFVETQIGDYLGEDDIVRYEDDFGRS